MSQKPNQRIVKERIAKAKEHAKKGEYQKARYFLSNVSSDPQAQKLLRQMDGRKDHMKIEAGRYVGGTVVIIAVLVVAVIYVFYNSVTEVRSNFASRDDVSAEFGERGLTGNRELFVDLVYFCYDLHTDNPEHCVDWGVDTHTNHETTVRDCIIVDEDDGLQYRNRPVEEMAACLVENGVPDPVR